jgi:carbonic anhydrase
MSALLSRRTLMHSLACGCAAALPSQLLAPSAFAASAVPKTALSADQALAKLKEGNAAFVQGGCVATGAPARFAELANGQAPFAIVLGCADSRTPPEHLFSRALGELFIVRVAGNTVDTAALGSIEYGVAVLGAPLIVVLGHSKCGAVEAAVKVVKEKAKFPGHIGPLVQPIVPAVLSVKNRADVLNAAIGANVERTVGQLRTAKPIVAKAVGEGKAKVVGGVYDLATGKVAFMA